MWRTARYVVKPNLLRVHYDALEQEFVISAVLE
jgi:hypothetical protein